MVKELIHIPFPIPKLDFAGDGIWTRLRKHGKITSPPGDVKRDVR